MYMHINLYIYIYMYIYIPAQGRATAVRAAAAAPQRTPPSKLVTPSKPNPHPKSAQKLHTLPNI